MRSRNLIRILFFCIIIVSIGGCTAEEIILHGDIGGIVTDAVTNQPLQTATVTLSPITETVTTGSDGKYLFKSLAPGNYQVHASKQNYAESKNNAVVTSANTIDIDFALDEIPSIHFSKTILDFGFYLTISSFTISKTGPGEVGYIYTPSKAWITVNPSSGVINNETDTIKVTINRVGLTDNLIEESIIVRSTYLHYVFQDTIDVSLKVYYKIVFNTDLSYGTVTDIEGNIYKTVQIGNQVWMAENLKTTKYKDNIPIPLVTDNSAWKSRTTPGYCWYNNEAEYKDLYGALYNWYTVKTEKLCPIGWHVPSDAEWHQMILFLDPTAVLGDTESSVAGNMIRETGITHWIKNEGATNEYGFTALPASERKETGVFDPVGLYAIWWTSTLYDATHPYLRALTAGYSAVGRAPLSLRNCGYSVRCIKDQP
jgi:uncharacterized protein (TIGR02145 family)